MTITRTRRLVPLLIATTFAVGGISLTTTSAFAAPAATAGVTTDDDHPGSSLITAYSKSGNLSKINSNAGTGSYNNPLLDKFSRVNFNNWDYPGRDDGSGGGVVWRTDDPNTAPVGFPPYAVDESRTDDARPGPIFTDEDNSSGKGSPGDAAGGDTEPPSGSTGAIDAGPVVN
ncbi:hypothetical protein [Streptomyces sp. NPDC088762]|uniref:hypothetical protein n=1 Tax=Streptomyces sp. NPDC088762 TaxID=3365891 RepID=UPI0038177533